MNQKRLHQEDKIIMDRFIQVSLKIIESIIAKKENINNFTLELTIIERYLSNFYFIEFRIYSFIMNINFIESRSLKKII